MNATNLITLLNNKLILTVWELTENIWQKMLL